MAEADYLRQRFGTVWLIGTFRRLVCWRWWNTIPNHLSSCRPSPRSRWLRSWCTFCSGRLS